MTLRVEQYKTRNEWLAARKRGIGGSDAAAALGLSPWKTRLELYLEKTGQLDDEEENEAMYRGRLLEPVVRQMYADATGRAVETPADYSIFHNSEIPFALADLDGIVPGDRLVECKTSRSHRGWGEPGTDDVPLVYLIQNAHYMAVTGLALADVPVLFGGFEFSIYSLAADSELQSLLLEGEAEFWELVQRRTPPEPSTNEDMVRRWPQALQKTGVTATEQDREVARLLAQVKEHITKCDEWKMAAESRLKNRIGEHDQLLYGAEVVATWGNTAGRTSFDSQRFAKDHPELYKQYRTSGQPGRRFLLKGDTPCLKSGTHNLPSISLPALPALPELG